MLIYTIIITAAAAFIVGFIAGYFLGNNTPKNEGIINTLKFEPTFSKDLLAFLKYDGTAQEV